MKTILLCVFIFGCAVLSAVTLLQENFSSTTFPPAGWTIEAPQPGAWGLSATNHAGGTANEARLNWTPGGYGTYRLISPPIDTRKVHDMTLSFRHMFDHYDWQESVSLAVELAHDPTAFDWELWYVAPPNDIAATPVTVPISFDLGMSETTYISFVFRGNNWYINSWYIDDILLTYTNTLGSGTWVTGNHYINGNLYVPDGHTLTLSAGSNIYMDQDKSVDVYGRLLSSGTAEQPVTFTQLPLVEPWLGINILVSNAANDSTLIEHTIIQGSIHRGVDIQYATKLRFSNCTIRNNSSPESSSGGGLLASGCTLTLKDCDFYNNYSPWEGAGAYITGSTLTASGNKFRNNTGQSAVTLAWTDVSGFTDNLIIKNACSADREAVHFLYGSGTFRRNLVANNSQRGICLHNSTLDILHCTIANNESYGLYNNSSTVNIRNTIFESNGDIGESEIYNAAASTNLYIHYSCLPWGTANIQGNGIAAANYANNQETHAQFVNPTVWGIAGDPLVADWRPAYNSCTIDTGDPISPLDPDGSRADIGMHYRKLKPLLTKAADVPADQGHQIDLVWQSSDIDVTFYPNSFYSVWREGASRTENAVFISDLADITQGFEPVGRDICFRDGNRTWYYLQQVWAMNFPDYGLIVPTLADSSSSGNHEVNFMVAYHNNNGIWQAVPMSGYSVDNIPPYPPSGPEITRTGADAYTLSWDEVTEGGAEGNSYPETNTITYKIYSGDAPDFEINPSTYLLSTTNPFALLNNQTAIHRFYRIVASDSE